MRRPMRLWTWGLCVVVLVCVCVAAQGFVGLDEEQDVSVRVDPGNVGWAVWVNYYDNDIEWHGPKYSGFYVWWDFHPAHFYDVWYGVFIYNQGTGSFVDALFQVATDY